MIFDKKILREQLISKRHRLHGDRVATISTEISKRIFNWQVWKDANCVHIYVTGKRNEIDTFPLIRASLKSGKRVFVPQILSKDENPLRSISVGRSTITVIEIFSVEELVDECWGIPQPVFDAEKKETDWAEIDLAIVPGLAFDKSGHRIGYGSGYYDRFLPELRSESIGLCFAENFFEMLPRGKYDVQVDYVMTEIALQPIFPKANRLKK